MQPYPSQNLSIIESDQASLLDQSYQQFVPLIIADGQSADLAELLKGVKEPVFQIGSTDNNTTQTNTITSFSNAGLLAPYANITTTEETFFSFAEANSDGLTHFRSLGSGVIGLEDLVGGGDRDYDDLMIRFDFQLAV